MWGTILLVFILVFGLLALALWLVNLLRAQRFTNLTACELSVIDLVKVDSRRRLVLIRRGNVEHLLMIGGPTDIVVEPNIVRRPAAARAPAVPRPASAGDTLPRAVPLGEGNTWPLRPEPAPRLEPVSRPEAPPHTPRAAAAPSEEAALPPSRDRSANNDQLAGLAEELAREPSTTEREPAPQPHRPAPRRDLHPRPAPVASAGTPSAGGQTRAPSDNLVEMAQRLEAVLRRPTEPAARTAAEPKASADTFAPPPAAELNEMASSISRSAVRPPTANVHELEAQWEMMDVSSETLLTEPIAESAFPAPKKRSTPADDRARRDNVECSVFAPANPTRGRRILIQALLHQANQFPQAIIKATAKDKSANRKGFAKLSTKVKRGAKVQLFLEIPKLDIESPLQKVTWEGAPIGIAYSVDVPVTAPTGPCRGTLHVMIGGVSVGEIIFEINISERILEKQKRFGIAGGFNDEDQQIDAVAIEAGRFARAFISYSRKDVQKVLLYAEALHDFGVKVLVDINAIEPGAEWQEEIAGFIERSDVFCLMWSQNAARSEWVDKEARIAVDRYNKSLKRVPRIRPVLIEHPVPDPPSYLKRFQFNSQWLALRVAHPLLSEPTTHPDGL
jgi:hypothetical protein